MNPISPRHAVYPGPSGRLLLCWLALLLWAAPTAAQTSPLQGLDQYIQQAMAVWEVPGLAVAVVKDDRVVLAKGYGVHEMGAANPVPVTEHTLFGIGSTTKAMTAAALGMLVDEGRIRWDDPVAKHLPDFALYDPWVTEQATIRDLLAHRVGIGRMIGNRIQYMTREPRSELIYRMRYLPPERPFRSGHVYQNVMYMTAGEIIPAVTGVSWDDFVRNQIFHPLGMRSTNTSIHQFRPHDPVASPHNVADGELVVIPPRDCDNIGPAGSVNSSAAEMAQWMRLQLGGGVYEGRRLLSQEVMQEMHRAQITLPSSPEDGLAAYGMGWRLSQYHGRMISQHGGGIDGMTTALMLVPQEQIGVVVLSNMLPHSLASAVARRVVDAYLDLPPRDWSAEMLAQSRTSQARAHALRADMEVARAAGSAPSLPLDLYVGAYEDDLYGRAEIRMVNGHLQLRFWEDEGSVLDLHHWHFDTFRALWPNPFHGEKFVWFNLDKGGRVAELNVEWNLRPPPSGYIRVTRFERVPG